MEPVWFDEDDDWFDDEGPACHPDCRQGDHHSECEWYDWRFGDGDHE